jgi:peptidoglycan LD-endopeptidase CwlK
MWIAIALYFVLACALAAMLMLPAFRAAVLHRARALWQRLRHVQRDVRQALGRKLQQGMARTAVGTRWAQRHALGIGIASALLALPPLAVFSLRAFHTLDAYDDITTLSAPDQVIAALLRGEQLVPPPPLPPELFTTAEVEQARPRLASADRRWDALDADFRQRLLLAYRLMREEHGYEMALIEGYRSPARQDMLAALGPQVTHAAAWQSLHQHGLAADSAFVRNGRLVISERDAWAAKGYALYGELAQRVGLTWGGAWRNADLGHVELRKPAVTRPKVGD